MSDFFQPRFFQPTIQRSLKALMRYALSEWTATVHGVWSDSSAWAAASSSIRLLVVAGSAPQISFSLPFHVRTAPQPPGPGLPEHAPSV